MIAMPTVCIRQNSSATWN